MVKTFSYQLLKKIRNQLVAYFANEADGMAFQIVEHFSGYSRTDILMDKSFTTAPQFERQIKQIISRALNNEPLQYILGKAYFYNRAFNVNQYTLIPRQETEELVNLILLDVENQKNLLILDIGTGSGCIPITLQLESSFHTIEGVDSSKQALEMAKINAKQLGAKVSFRLLNILEDILPKKYDVLVSNPPYVLDKEKVEMKQNVLKYEPHTALFVPDDNPLLFYKRIVELAVNALNRNGRLYFEINEQFGDEVVELLQSHGFNQVVLRKDLSGKDRFVSGLLTSAKNTTS